MKSSYELAMERLNKVSPSLKLSADQKRQLAELESVYAAKIAGREITMKGEIQAATGRGDYENAEKLEKQLVQERRSLQTELEDKKQKVR